MSQVSVVVPVYNEVESLPLLYDSIVAALTPTSLSFEIVLVDDGSVDGSSALLDDVARRDARVRVLHFDGNFGQTAAFDAGFKAARGDVVVTIDADLQNDPADIPMVVAACREATVVCGIRTKREDSLVRRVSSRVANAVRRAATGDPVIDTGCSLKAFRRADLLKIKLFTGMHRFLPVLLEMEGCAIVQLPVKHHPRRFGRSKYGIGNRLFRGIKDLFAVRWMQQRHLGYRIRSES
ncbi:MAG: glycosyltransferase family 2 protein [Planctomycetes bacterium]|nr:glycosyltransferase family 2 protein [Planctomycetota bacterium]MBI3846916.1 glycosyltransferase family 2 protein [Planctomycetota bacterium]